MTDRDQLSPLDEAALRAQATGDQAYWRSLDVVAQTGSTNADLLARAASGVDIDGHVLIAEYQTAGRGLHDRQWAASPAEQITMSVGVRVHDVPTAGWGWLALATCLSVLNTLVEAGEKDTHRLTVCGLTYLRELDGSSDPVKAGFTGL